jgi:hypothetical protein
MWRMHASTVNKWHKKKKKKKSHMWTHGAIRECGLTSWMVCINDKCHDIRERNVAIKSEIWTTNIRSLRFPDIGECVTLWGLILRSLGCTKRVFRHVRDNIKKLFRITTTDLYFQTLCLEPLYKVHWRGCKCLNNVKLWRLEKPSRNGEDFKVKIILHIALY